MLFPIVPWYMAFEGFCSRKYVDGWLGYWANDCYGVCINFLQMRQNLKLFAICFASRSLDRKEAPESVQASSHKSQDAAVGILVHMLKTAPPLRQDHSYSSQSSRSEFNVEIGTSSLFMSRKTSDALEELQSYKEIKDILLSRSGTQLLESVQHRKE